MVKAMFLLSPVYQALPLVPIPFVCVSAMIIFPFCFSCMAISFAYVCVEEISLKYSISFPIYFVFAFFIFSKFILYSPMCCSSIIMQSYAIFTFILHSKFHNQLLVYQVLLIYTNLIL